MSQADQQVQNAAFPAVRTDINDNLAALYSQSSGASAPAVTVAFQPWIDISSSPAVWKVRNASNTGWITIGTIDATTFNTGGITAIANGGTGQTTATAALAALLPSQTGNSGKALTTDGSLASWGTIATSQVYQFDASGTWTKPAIGTGALVIIWGGGGGGGTTGTSQSNGGGGGGCFHGTFKLSDLPSTVSVTVGSGGTPNNGGGTSSFGTYMYALGGATGFASTTVAGPTGGGAGFNGGNSSIFAGGNGANSTAGAPGVGIFGGGGGGGNVGSTSGAKSYWGGGGGAYGAGTAGASLFGGNGGASGANGSVPGGGGGGVNAGVTGSGGAGRCIIYVW